MNESNEIRESPRKDDLRKNSKEFWRKRKWWIVSSASLLLLFVIVISATTAVRRNRRSSSLWTETSPTSRNQGVAAKIAGTWHDRLVVASLADDSVIGIIDLYRLVENKWELQSSIETDGVIESMDVSETGSRLVISLADPLRFEVYEMENEIYTQFGPTLYARDLVANTSTEKFDRPNVMMSDNGRVLGLAFQPALAQDSTVQKVHVLQDIASDGTWFPLGKISDGHEDDHGDFATFTAMSGDGKKLLIASEVQSLTLYVWNGQAWALTAAFDESPLVDTGSLALSKDGATFAVGSFNGVHEGTGQLHVNNPVWTWYNYDEEGQHDENIEIQVALSAEGRSVVVGRYYPNEDRSSLQVYEFQFSDNEWTARGPEFGRRNGMLATVDMSDDGLQVVAVIDGSVVSYDTNEIDN